MRRTLKIIIISMLIAAQMLLLSYADTREVRGSSIWLDWTKYTKAKSNDPEHYGDYSLEAGDELSDFLSFLTENYDGFDPLAEFIGRSKEEMVSDEDALRAAWDNAEKAHKTDLRRAQDEFIYDRYYAPAYAALSDAGIDLDSIYDPALAGTAISIYMENTRKGVTPPMKPFSNTYSESLKGKDWLNVIYLAESRLVPDTDDRWKKKQKEEAEANCKDPGAHSSEIVTGSSGGTYNDDALDQWLLDHAETKNVTTLLTSGLTHEFLLDGWEQRREWARTMRELGDFVELYGIEGGRLTAPGGTSINLYQWGVDNIPWSVDAAEALIGMGVEEALGAAGVVVKAHPKYSQDLRNSPGFCDCSSFVNLVLGEAWSDYISYEGSDTAASIAQRLVESGAAISKSKIKAGDLLFFMTNDPTAPAVKENRFGHISHVAIYIGRNEDGTHRIVDASGSNSNPQVGIRDRDLDHDSKFILACRPYHYSDE